MRKITNAETIKIGALELPIDTHSGKFNCYVEPLERIKRELDAMLSHHRKIFVFRCDIRIHTYSDDNEVISKFIKTFVRWAKGNYGLKRVGYAWCREVETAKKQHYHLIFMLGGSKVNVAGKVFEKIADIASVQDLSPWFCDNPTYFIKRKDLENGNYTKYNNAFYRASYLAKERGKKIKGERANSFQTSRINPRLNEQGDVFKAGDDYSKRINEVVTSQPMTDAERQIPLF